MTTETPLTDAVVAKSLRENGGKFMAEDLLMHARKLELANKLLENSFDEGYGCGVNSMRSN